MIGLVQREGFTMISKRCVIALAGCLLATVPAHADTEAVLYSFAGGSDSAEPFASLFNAGGLLYGTASFGGGSTNCENGCGTVFTITPSGQETVLYSFKGGRDGAHPDANLLKFDGRFYGTTGVGGSSNCADGDGCGTVFSLTSAGKEKVLYPFDVGDNGSSTDGITPIGSLINLGGTFYGVTGSGSGAAEYGTVFSVTPADSESVVYEFPDSGGGGHFFDGAFPTAGLINVGGVLYGTAGGGTAGEGVVFSVTPSGSENVVYSFKGSGDGANPSGGLINIGGVLYGTTQDGGAPSGGCPGGCGTVFSVTTAGVETVLYSFTGVHDGAYPRSSLLKVGDKLVGTTQWGGDITCNKHQEFEGCGTVFSVTLTGTEKILHSFRGGSDGTYPFAGLIDVGGVLYGTTSSGGANNLGTVFSLTR
jgi:uncharacterized repeat protein (TIGR03803 family)